MVQKFQELMLLVHPNWLFYGPRHGRGIWEKLFIEKLYSQGKPQLLPPEILSQKFSYEPDSMDWKRFRREMFHRYGSAILEAERNPRIFVAVFPVPMKMSEYKAVAGNDRVAMKKAVHSDFLRLLSFARKRLGKRLVVVNTPVIEFEKTAKRLKRVIERKGIVFEEGFLVKGFGEISDMKGERPGKECVRMLLGEIGKVFPGSRLVVDERYCGDVLVGVKARRIRRHTKENYLKAARKKALALKRKK
ncbi:MAG: hypothetical protein QXK06_01105 [Candidatus Diapherotrites archaeon]